MFSYVSAYFSYPSKYQNVLMSLDASLFFKITELMEMQKSKSLTLYVPGGAFIIRVFITSRGIVIAVAVAPYYKQRTCLLQLHKLYRLYV